MTDFYDFCAFYQFPLFVEGRERNFGRSSFRSFTVVGSQVKEGK
jgi:hypothetical protein